MENAISLLATCTLLSACTITHDLLYLGLGFNSYENTPVILTHYAMEMPLAETPPMLIAGAADQSMLERNGGGAGNSVLSPPKDVGRDGQWQVSAQWIELMTNKAYRAKLNVPIKDIHIEHGGYVFTPIFGPNGLMMIGSDKVGLDESYRRNIVAVCGERVSSADAEWKDKQGILPGIEIILPKIPKPADYTDCRIPALTKNK